ncbi:O-methyltransferase [Egicoccus halophilus]|uniref:O-methyltransferase n=1 Tax=Egicoccus halophilus TaxID=1670830 RepID=A0A8J3ET03_9ACTN|nr:class I SAM-dependent methyltransferase [Egicoccus halophilus]GGI08534.1 O-methyltransferase [Egicoccus halophilus]
MNRRASLPGIDALFGSPQSGGAERAEEPLTSATPSLPAGVPETEGVVAARQRVPEGTDVPDAAGTSLLGWLVSTGSVRTAVEIGSAAGVSGLALLASLAERGVLTSIEPDGQLHGLAGEAYRSVRAGARVRSIHGDATTVLPRLTDGGYDLVVWQLPVTDAAATIDHARRLLRPGGILLARGLVTAPEARWEAEAFILALVDDEDFAVSVLPVDGGVVLATHRAAPPA